MATQWKSLVVIHEVQYVGVTLCVGLQVPTDGAGGFAPGCLMILYVEGNVNGSPYVNTSSSQQSCRFRPVGGGPLTNDVTRRTASGKEVGYTNPNRVDSISQAIADAQSGDIITIGAGTFACGTRKFIVPQPNVVISGIDRAVTFLTSTTQVDALYPGEQAGQPMFSLADGSVVQDMSISDSPANFNEDGATIGFCQALVPTGVKATLRRLYLDCNDWTVYNYVSQATFVIEDCEIHSGRFCIAMANSGLGQTCIVRGCQLVVDAMKSKSVGESSNQTYGHATGIVHMGGLLQVYETSFNVLGSPNADGHTAVDAGSNPISWAPYTTGITDTYNHGPATATAWEIRSCSFAVNPNGVTLANHTGDLRMTGPNTNSTLKLFWCDGDGSSNVTSKLLV